MRQSWRLLVSNHPRDAYLIDQRQATDQGLLRDRGSSVGNIFAGGIMIAVIGTVLPVSVGWALNGGWKLFDMFVGAVQAFIFALLTVIYFSQSMELRDEHH